MLSIARSRDEGSAPEVSIVVPCYNEEENLEPLHAEITATMARLGLRYEVIYIDDGSQDRTHERLEEIWERDLAVRVIRFRRNYGQTAALSAGFRYARADVVVTMDADLQNDPADIPKLLAKLDEGYDLVSGWREKREDRLFTRKVPSWLANWVIRKIIDVPIHDFGCTLKAYRRGVFDGIRLYGEMHRFIPALASFLGIRMAEIPVHHRPRVHGSSSYGLGRTPRVILDLVNVKFFVHYFARPSHIFARLGFHLLWPCALLSAAGFALMATGALEVPYWASALVLVLGILIFGQFLVAGLLGEIVMRAYHESQERPVYVVERVLNGGERKGAGEENRARRPAELRAGAGGP
ncbi:MAG: glycosyltransferase family 2 protein [Planctomycetes bacterium]|nr:glycosyltransferase family 2 protein [Planctomycetota bacterium]